MSSILVVVWEVEAVVEEEGRARGFVVVVVEDIVRTTLLWRVRGRRRRFEEDLVMWKRCI